MEEKNGAALAAKPASQRARRLARWALVLLPAAAVALVLFLAARGRSVPVLLRDLESADPRVAGSAAECLLELGPRADRHAPVLAEALGAQSERVRYYAAQALTRLSHDALRTIRSPTAMTALRAGLRSANRRTALTAAKILWGITGDAGEVLPTIMAATNYDNSGATAEDAFRVLGEMGPAAASAASMLAHCLQSYGPKHWWPLQRRKLAAESLHRIGPAAVPVLVRELADAREVEPGSDFEARRRKAIQAALQIVGPATAREAPALRKLLEHGDERVRKAAAEALAKIRGSGE